MPRELRCARIIGREEVGDVHRVELIVARAAGDVYDLRAVLAEAEARHAFARVGDALRFAAVEPQHVDLIASAARRAAAAATGGRGPSRRTAGRVAIRQERDEAAVVRPLGARLVLVLGERELPRARHAAVGGDEIEIALPPRGAPV